MTPADPAATPDRDASTPPDHPAGSDQTVSAGEALSGRGGTDGALQPSDGPAYDADRDRTRPSEPERSRRAGPPPDHDRIEDDDSDLVEDAIEFFNAGGEDDSPASDSDAPAPG